MHVQKNSAKSLDANALEKLRSFLASSKSQDLICSSLYEFTPWYRYNFGFLVLCVICGIKLKYSDVWRVCKSSGYNLLFRSKVAAALCEAQMASSHSDIIFSWLLNDRETRIDCIRRYFGRLTDDETYKTAPMWVLATFVPSTETIRRLNAEGVSIVWDVRPSLRDVFRAVGSLFFLNPLVWIDSEYWKGRQIAQFFTSWLRRSQISAPTVYLPYEQQPWQLNLTRHLKKTFGTQATVIGDVHSSLNNFPSQFIRTAVSPDRLMVHGNAYKRVLTAMCDWPESCITVKPSHRFSKRLVFEKSQVVLPYVMSDGLALISAIRLVSKRNDDTAPWELRPHPARIADTKYQEIAAGIEQEVVHLNRHLNVNGRPYILVYGVSTYIFEALESGYDVYNILEHPETDAYPPDIWDGIQVEKLSEHLFHYNLRMPGDFIII